MNSEISYFVALCCLLGEYPIPDFFEVNSNIKKEDKLYIFANVITKFFSINGKKIVIVLPSTLGSNWRLKDESIGFEDFTIKCKTEKSKYFLRSIQSKEYIWEGIYITKYGYCETYTIVAAKLTENAFDGNTFEYEKKFYKEFYIENEEHNSGYAFEIISLDREKFKNLFRYLIKDKKVPDKFKRIEIFSHIIQFL